MNVKSARITHLQTKASCFALSYKGAPGVYRKVLIIKLLPHGINALSVPFRHSLSMAHICTARLYSVFSVSSRQKLKCGDKLFWLSLIVLKKL